MLGSCLRLMALAVLVGGCGEAARTFEPGVEHLPGPASVVVRIEPAAAATTSLIELLTDDGSIRTFPGRRDDARYLSGTALPATIRAQVDEAPCTGEIDLIEDFQEDATLTVTPEGCDLRLDLQHPTGSIDHGLDDVP